jgi:hypothetical protein
VGLASLVFYLGLRLFEPCIPLLRLTTIYTKFCTYGVTKLPSQGWGMNSDHNTVLGDPQGAYLYSGTKS